MKQYKSIYFILPLIALVLMSCQFVTVDIERHTLRGSGDVKTETRAVKNFERVVLEDRGELTLIQGDEEGLTIEADDNLLPLIRTETHGRELVLEIDDGYNVIGDATIRYTLKVKELNHVSVVGAGIVTADALEANNLTLRVAGSGNMTISDLTAETLNVEASGSGNYTLEGAVRQQSVTINGAGNYLAGDLESQEARLTISGAGNATLWAEDQLDIQVNGFGNVGYYGSPKISQKMAGGGGVNALGKHE